MPCSETTAASATEDASCLFCSALYCAALALLLC